MKLIFVSGRYSGSCYTETEDNIMNARTAALQLYSKGWAVITPHLNTAHFDSHDRLTNMNERKWYKVYKEILSRCDAIFMIGNWLTSAGAKTEHDFAKEKGITIFYESNGFPSLGDIN